MVNQSNQCDLGRFFVIQLFLMSAGTVLTPLGTIVTPKGTVVNEGQIGNNPYMYQCSTENRYTVLQDKSYSDVINTNSTAKLHLI